MYFLRLVCRSAADATHAMLQLFLESITSRNDSIQQMTRQRGSPRRALFWPAATTLILAASYAGAQTSFTDVTAGSGVEHFSETYGASFGDVNGDGFPDLFVSNHRTMKSLFQNKGNGTFVDVGSKTPTWDNRPGADTHGASWADYNNDGTQDLLVSLGTGNPSEWFVNQKGKLDFETLGSGLELENLGGRMPVWLDYDNDKRLDVLVAQYGGVAKLFHQNKDSTFTELERLRQVAVHTFPLCAAGGRERGWPAGCAVPGRGHVPAEDLRHLELPMEEIV